MHLKGFPQVPTSNDLGILEITKGSIDKVAEEGGFLSMQPSRFIVRPPMF